MSISVDPIVYAVALGLLAPLALDDHEGGGEPIACPCGPGPFPDRADALARGPCDDVP